jgi:hypothetical protein
MSQSEYEKWSLNSYFYTPVIPLSDIEPQSAQGTASSSSSSSHALFKTHSQATLALHTEERAISSAPTATVFSPIAVQNVNFAVPRAGGGSSLPARLRFDALTITVPPPAPLPTATRPLPLQPHCCVAPPPPHTFQFVTSAATGSASASPTTAGNAVVGGNVAQVKQQLTRTAFPALALASTSAPMHASGKHRQAHSAVLPGRRQPLHDWRSIFSITFWTCHVVLRRIAASIAILRKYRHCYQISPSSQFHCHGKVKSRDSGNEMASKRTRKTIK